MWLENGEFPHHDRGYVNTQEEENKTAFILAPIAPYASLLTNVGMVLKSLGKTCILFKSSK